MPGKEIPIQDVGGKKQIVLPPNALYIELE